MPPGETPPIDYALSPLLIELRHLDHSYLSERIGNASEDETRPALLLSKRFGPTVWLLKLYEEMSEPVRDGLCKIVIGKEISPDSRLNAGQSPRGCYWIDLRGNRSDQSSDRIVKSIYRTQAAFGPSVQWACGKVRRMGLFDCVVVLFRRGASSPRLHGASSPRLAAIATAKSETPRWFREPHQKIFHEHKNCHLNAIGTARIKVDCSSMETSMEYREFARECDRLAQQAKTDHERNTWKKMAEAWREVADQDDENILSRPQ
jgi:hypothetical protein